jgi:GNAT superfamily N-acetyltransferase
VPAEHEFVGWSDATLELGDGFAYAGKFRVPSGKAVTRDGDEVVAALSFSPDRADDDGVRVRYFAVRSDRRGEGLGSSLLRFASDLLLDRYATVRISVNNPYAYEAAHKAGFVWTGETSGIAELVMRKPSREDADTVGRYAEGLRRFLGRDLTEEERGFVRRKLG